MSQSAEKIAQYRKMATDAPLEEVAHFRLGQLLLEDKQYEEAIKSFRQALELSPTFAKVFELLARCLIQLQKKSEAIEVLQQGIVVAEQGGHNLPRDAMAKMLTELGVEPPAVQRPAAVGGTSGFQCSCPRCAAGADARKLPRPPMGDELGKQIFDSVCADCWTYWVRDMSVKVINEERLDLSTDQGQKAYDQMMKMTLGLT